MPVTHIDVPRRCQGVSLPCSACRAIRHLVARCPNDIDRHVDLGARVAGLDRYVTAVLHDVGEDSAQIGRQRNSLTRCPCGYAREGDEERRDRTQREHQPVITANAKGSIVCPSGSSGRHTAAGVLVPGLARTAALEAVVLDRLQRGHVVVRQPDCARPTKHRLKVGRRWQISIGVDVGDLV